MFRSTFILRPAEIKSRFYLCNRKLFSVMNEYENHHRFIHRSSTKKCIKRLTASVAESRIGMMERQWIQRLPQIDINVGNVAHGFRCLRRVPIDTFSVVAFEFVHEATGASYIHINSDAVNNTFGIGFRTCPKDSTGVAHILEHTVLCGSKKYPVRDPFFNMMKRSFSNFMNAFTAPDYTLYPFSTTNAADFNNLMSVYVDAVFFPLLTEDDFKQEGHRLDFISEVINNENISVKLPQLTYKGVVYNEMKGAMSDSNSVFIHELSKNLFSSTTYRHNSGGDPECIPSLTYEKLIQFHRDHYHPSNAMIFSFGNLSVIGHLERLNNTALASFQKICPDTQVGLQPCGREIEVEAVCVPDPVISDESKQIRIGIAWLLNDINLNSFETFSLSILSSLLLDGPSAPMYKSLIDPQLGSGYSPQTGYDHHSRQGVFSIGLQGVAEKDISSVKAAILNTLKLVSISGFDDRRIEGILHQMELSQKHVKTNFGLSILTSSMPFWLHGGDPLTPLFINDHIIQLKKELLTNKRYFNDLIEHQLLNNNHRVILTVRPDPELQDKKDSNELKALNDIVLSLTENDLKKIKNDSERLRSAQMTTQNLDCLPSVSLLDVNRNIDPCLTVVKNLESSNMSSTLLYWSPQTTNGVTYLSSSLNLPDSSFPQYLRPFLPFYSSILPSMGTDTMSYSDLSDEIERYTGGISFGVSYHSHHTESTKQSDVFSFGSHCLNRNTNQMISLISQIVSAPNFSDIDRLTNLMTQHVADLATSLQDNGHSYARLSAASHVSQTSKKLEEWRGLSHVCFMNELVQLNNFQLLSQVLEGVHSHILRHFDHKKWLAVADSSIEETIERAIKKVNLVKPIAFNDNKTNMTASSSISFGRRGFLALPIDANHTSSAYPAVSYTNPDAPVLSILAQIMSSCFLHKHIREHGGAYGSGASYSPWECVFSFYSYRDPESLTTLRKYRESIDWASSGHFSDSDIEQARISVLSSLDAPKHPSSHGRGLFQYGITDAMRQQYRDGIFSCDRRDLIRVCDKYLGQVSVVSERVVGNELKIPSLVQGGEDDWVLLTGYSLGGDIGNRHEI